MSLAFLVFIGAYKEKVDFFEKKEKDDVVKFVVIR